MVLTGPFPTLFYDSRLFKILPKTLVSARQWWPMFLSLALGRQRQVALEFKGSGFTDQVPRQSRVTQRNHVSKKQNPDKLFLQEAIKLHSPFCSWCMLSIRPLRQSYCEVSRVQIVTGGAQSQTPLIETV